MMRTFLFFAVITALTLSSCKKDKDADPSYCAGAWASEVSTEWSEVIAAATAYGTNPTHETCVAYKEAYQDYIDALKPYLQCTAWTPDQMAQLQDAIDEAEEDIETLCDE